MTQPDTQTLLVLFCKRPQPGVGKQRIAARLGAARALEVAHLLLNAALEDLRAWPGATAIAPAEQMDADWAARLLPGTTVVAQGDGNLGARINRVDAALRGQGARRILYIGIDAPGLTGAALAQADASLAAADAVVIPAADGGVTLLGAARPWPELADLPWETSALGAALQARCAEHGWHCAALPTGNDIDTWDDLRNALPLLRADPRPARQALAAWIEQQQSISVVVPVHNDQSALTRLLHRLANLATELTEVCVVDSSDRPEARQLCTHFGARYVVATACRGAQLDTGAQHARGAILWFLHADCTPASNAPRLIRDHLAGGALGGYFQFRFRGARAWYKRWLETAINWRANVGVPYGDQGLFVERAAYAAAGGFAAEPLFEEVALVKALRRRGEFSSVNASIGVSPRRWERDGWVRRTVWNRLLALGHMLGIAPAKLARRYQGKPPHKPLAAESAQSNPL